MGCVDGVYDIYLREYEAKRDIFWPKTAKNRGIGAKIPLMKYSNGFKCQVRC